LNSDMLTPSNVKLEEKPVSQSAEQDGFQDVSDGDCSSSDAGSDSDDDTATAPQQPDTPRHQHSDVPEVSTAAGAVLASNSMAIPPVPLRATSPCLRATHPALPHTSQGFVALSDINTASGQGHSHSVSSSPSSALGGTSSDLLDRTNTNGSSGLTEQKGKRKADQMDLDTILDPAEKKKQRRLAKNRATAALSRYLPRPSVTFCYLDKQNLVLKQVFHCLTWAICLQGAKEGTVAGAAAEGAHT